MTAPGFSSPPVRVLLFARYAELLGTDHLELPADSVRTAADVLAQIRGMAGGEHVGVGALVAVNLKQASSTTPVVPGDEVALLPPLAGG